MVKVKVHDFWGYVSSVAALAEVSLRSPLKLFIFIIRKYIYRIKVSKINNDLILKKTSLVVSATTKSSLLAFVQVPARLRESTRGGTRRRCICYQLSQQHDVGHQILRSATTV